MKNKLLVFAIGLLLLSSGMMAGVGENESENTRKLQERQEEGIKELSMFKHSYEMRENTTFNEEFDSIFSSVEDADRIAKVEINERVKEAEGLTAFTIIGFDVFESSYTLEVNTDSVTVEDEEISYRGSVRGSKFGYFTFSSHEGKVSTTIRLPEIGRRYLVRYDEDMEGHYLYGIYREGLEQDVKDLIDYSGNDPTYSTNTDISNSDLEIAQNEIVDVMIVYTPNARNWASRNEGSINNVINEATGTTNTILSNSNTDVRLNTIYTSEVDYSETGDDLGTDLSRLRDQNDGYMEEIHDWRDYYGADLVSLMVERDQDSDWRGVAYAPREEHQLNPNNGFSVVSVQESSSTDLFAHEIGHNFGAGHAKDQDDYPGPQLYDYSAGWRWITGTWPGRRRYRTVMAYNTYDWGFFDYEPVPYFSNPNIRHSDNDEPMGCPDDGDNARTIRETRSELADYQEPTPQIDIISPTGGEEWYEGSEQQIEWDTVIGDNGIDGIDLFYSTDGGSTWTTIDENVPDRGSYSWEVPDEPDTTVLIRAEAIDGAGYSREDTILDEVKILEDDTGIDDTVLDVGQDLPWPGILLLIILAVLITFLLLVAKGRKKSEYGTQNFDHHGGSSTGRYKQDVQVKDKTPPPPASDEIQKDKAPPAPPPDKVEAGMAQRSAESSGVVGAVSSTSGGVTCPDCRSLNRKGSTHCMNCGKKIEGSVEKRSDRKQPPPPSQSSQQQRNPSCPDCGRTMRYIMERDRWYCDRCHKYDSRRQRDQKDIGAKRELAECGRCGAYIPYHFSSCPECGVEFSMGTVKCSECGAWLDSDMERCPECGSYFYS